MSVDQVKAVVFDVFGTVVDWRTSIAREVEIVLKETAPDTDWIDFAHRWRAEYQPSMEEIRSGRRGYTILDTLHRENLDKVLTDLGMTSVDEPTRQLLNTAWHRLSPWPDVVAGLRRLKTGYIIGTLSNGNIALMVNLAKSAELPWDVILGSEITNAYKPSPEAYVRTADALALATDEVMLVAAHNGDLQAAREQGMRTAFVARPEEYGPDQSIDLVPEQDWDIVADDFVGLAQALEC